MSELTRNFRAFEDQAGTASYCMVRIENLPIA